MAITSLLLSNGVGGLVPSADVNIDPNNPVDPAAQHLYNTVCIQVRLSSATDWLPRPVTVLWTAQLFSICEDTLGRRCHIGCIVSWDVPSMHV